MLKSWNAVRVLESLWLATLDNTATAVRDALKASADKDDSVVVIELKANSAWGSWRGQPAGVEWLKKHL